MTTTLPRPQRTSGESRVAFALREDRTRLADLYQRDPCRGLFPEPELGEPSQAVLITMSGGVTDGDALSMAVAVGTRAEAVATALAAVNATLVAIAVLSPDEVGTATPLLDWCSLRRETRYARLFHS